MADEEGFECRIFNLKFDEYMYAADAEPYDESRRHVFFWRPGDHDDMCHWKLIPADDNHKQERKYYLYNVYQDEYFYAADHAPFDDDRRSAFSWIPKDRDYMGVWRIEPTKNKHEYAIYNVYQKEYLYAADIPFDDQRRNVFTWREGIRLGSRGRFRFEWFGDNPLD